MDIFYPRWKLQMAMNQKLFSIISQLWCISLHHNPKDFDLSSNHKKEWNPKMHSFGPFDCSKGYIYMDRIGYRIPTELAKTIGTKSRPIQRSLTPHLDCCPPHTLHYSPGDKIDIDNNGNGNIPLLSKWRPLQSMISLTSNERPNTGGFEAVKGFHQTFYEWTLNRLPTIRGDKSYPAPCIGQFTPIRPREDRNVIEKMEHIPCKAGSVVIWDYRIPHANARRNDSNESRAVIYASFLPDVDLNRRYVERQLNDFRKNKHPTDQWIDPSENDCDVDRVFQDDNEFTTFEKKLLGIEKWDTNTNESIK